MLGIDVNEVTEVKIGDATFKIGIIPYGIRLKLEGVAIRYNTDEANAEEMLAENFEKIVLENADYVRYGIRGHAGIVDKDGKEIPFKSHVETSGNSEATVVDDETINLYMIMGIFTKLFLEVKKANTLTEQEAKN